jgi:acetyl esterase/lipase
VTTPAIPQPFVARRTSSSAGEVLAIAGTVLLVLASAMVVVPPLSMGMLVLAVGAAEYSPLLALLDLVWMLVARRLLRGRRFLRLGAMTLLLLAAVAAIRPLAQFDRTARDASAQLGTDEDVARYSPLDAFRQPVAHGAGTERSIAYRAADGTPLTMRLHHGAIAGPRPTVVVIHGGAWRSGDATQGEGMSRALAARGYTVASIDYRHAPAARFPAQLDDVRRSLALLHDSATAWQVDTSRIALLGRSSGGHLAELAAWSVIQPGVRAVVAIYAPFDLVRGFEEPPVPDPIGVRAVISDFLGGTPEQQPARYAAASPAARVRPGLPPTLLLYGAHDHVVRPEFNRDAANRLRAARVPVVEVEVPWAEHGFDMAPGGLGAQLASNVVIAFLARFLGAG